jgi:2-(1,2-epoxy-1,2-dihydrophenyl)acetyl-CoA isomerase
LDLGIREETAVSGKTVLIAESGGVTRLTLNRPDKLNAFTLGMHAELRAGLEAANADPQCRVVILTGAGRAFLGRPGPGRDRRTLRMRQGRTPAAGWRRPTIR